MSCIGVGGWSTPAPPGSATAKAIASPSRGAHATGGRSYCDDEAERTACQNWWRRLNATINTEFFNFGNEKAKPKDLSI